MRRWHPAGTSSQRKEVLTTGLCRKGRCYRTFLRTGTTVVRLEGPSWKGALSSGSAATRRTLRRGGLLGKDRLSERFTMDRLATHHGRQVPGFKEPSARGRAAMLGDAGCESRTVWSNVDGRKYQVLATIILYTKVALTGWYSPLSTSRLLLELAAGHGP